MMGRAGLALLFCLAFLPLVRPQLYVQTFSLIGPTRKAYLTKLNTTTGNRTYIGPHTNFNKLIFTGESTIENGNGTLYAVGFYRHTPNRAYRLFAISLATGFILSDHIVPLKKQFGSPLYLHYAPDEAAVILVGDDEKTGNLTMVSFDTYTQKMTQLGPVGPPKRGSATIWGCSGLDFSRKIFWFQYAVKNGPEDYVTRTFGVNYVSGNQDWEIGYSHAMLSLVYHPYKDMFYGLGSPKAGAGPDDGLALISFNPQSHAYTVIRSFNSAGMFLTDLAALDTTKNIFYAAISGVDASGAEDYEGLAPERKWLSSSMRGAHTLRLFDAHGPAHQSVHDWGAGEEEGEEEGVPPPQPPPKGNEPYPMGTPYIYPTFPFAPVVNYFLPFVGLDIDSGDVNSTAPFCPHMNDCPWNFHFRNAV